MSASLLLAGLAAGIVAASPAAALEGGQSPYLKGFRDFQTGRIPLEPGVQMRVDTYYYSGSGNVGSNGTRRIDGSLSAFAGMLGPLITTPWQILGGTYALGARITATDLSAERITVLRNVPTIAQGQLDAFNDTQVTPVLIGWHAGNFHWNVGASVWIPTGSYSVSRVANTSRNYASTAGHAALTYLDPVSGWDASIAAAYVVNRENTVTHYHSGNVLHVDFAVGRNLTPDFRVGVVGYVMQQVTGDTGAGAIFGDNIAKVVGLGPAMSYRVTLADMPVTLVAKYYREFDAHNTTQGNAATLSARFNF